MWLHYRINPTPPPGQGFTEAQVIDVFKRGAQHWMDANPNVHALYDGTTRDQPAGFNNVVGFAPSETSKTISSRTGDGKYLLAFNIILSSAVAWEWRPCNPPTTPCDPYASSKGEDLESTSTHEWGHAFGLDHVAEPELTMNGSPGNSPPGYIDRQSVTLGRGDVLGLRKLYPTDAPMPTIHRP